MWPFQRFWVRQVSVVTSGFVSVLCLAFAGAAEDDSQKWQDLLAAINSEEGELWLSVHPSGDMAIYDQHDGGFGQHRIFLTTYTNGQWEKPVLAPFGVDLEERGARFAPDGKSVVFASTRTPNGSASDDWNIWHARFENGSWLAAEMLPAPVNSEAPDFHPSISANGTLYFSSRRDGGAGASDMYVARPTGSGWTVTPLADFNTDKSEPDPFITADGSSLYFARTDGAGGFGGDDLYVSRNIGGKWQPAINLGQSVNTKEYEYGASLSPDGKFLFYTSFEPGHADIRMMRINDK